MSRFFIHRYAHAGVISLILTSFSLTYAIPIQAVPPTCQIGLNEIAFMVRMEKLVEKMWKLEKSGNREKMYELALDIKQEVQGALGKEIDLNKCLDSVENEIKKNGNKPPKKEFDSIRKSLTKKDKKNKKHAYYLACTMDIEGYQFNEHDENLFDDNLMFMAKSGKDKDKDKDDKPELEVPAHLVFGVTLTLCGVFLMFLPIPGCKVWGDNMFRAGIVVCGNAICNKTEEDKKNEKNKKD